MLSLFLGAIALISTANGQTCSATAYLNNNCGGAISIPYSFRTNGQCTAPTGLASCYYTASCQGNGISVTIYDSNGCGQPQHQVFLALDTSSCQTFRGCNDAWVQMDSIACCSGQDNALNRMLQLPIVQKAEKVIGDFEEFILGNDHADNKKPFSL